MNTVPSPTSRSGKRIYLSFWDVFWALVSPIIALYLRDALIIYPPDWSAIGLYWVHQRGIRPAGFFLIQASGRLQPQFFRAGSNRHCGSNFVRDASDLRAAVYDNSTEWHSAVNAADPWSNIGSWTDWHKDDCAHDVRWRLWVARISKSCR